MTNQPSNQMTNQPTNQMTKQPTQPNPTQPNHVELSTTPEATSCAAIR
jgi:hypothetical protein